ncbi:hypothetical protein PACTADRAFT_4378 [Pachysolen tannophilus NRRL Y-2460]|uniref:Protein LOT5 n=1 Tax=Pachysolen tannophilus NRRL Y-2460 TaxID=669874 RepID=A0A1E4TRS2_PACTA|nr:hypothetical protein PACTADRAFT_4378 [Pachysolen tannophilus NRRL Y-2460]
MSRSSSRLVLSRPSISNTEVISGNENLSSVEFSVGEHSILYAGHDGIMIKDDHQRNFRKLISTFISESKEEDFSDAELYVLNTSFIIWLNELAKGIEFPYQNLILHALQKDDVGKTWLYLQISSDTNLDDNEEGDLGNTIELSLAICGEEKTRERTSNPLLEQVNSNYRDNNKVLENIYESLTTCTSFHLDPDSEDEEQQQAVGGPIFIAPDQNSPTNDDDDGDEDNDNDEVVATTNENKSEDDLTDARVNHTYQETNEHESATATVDVDLVSSSGARTRKETEKKRESVTNGNGKATRKIRKLE